MSIVSVGFMTLTVSVDKSVPGKGEKEKVGEERERVRGSERLGVERERLG